MYHSGLVGDGSLGGRVTVIGGTRLHGRRGGPVGDRQLDRHQLNDWILERSDGGDGGDCRFPASPGTGPGYT